MTASNISAATQKKQTKFILLNKNSAHDHKSVGWLFGLLLLIET